MGTDDVAGGECNVWDITVGCYGNRSGERVEYGNDMGDTFPDLTGEVNGSNDPWGR